MKLTIIVDNKAADHLCAEHGFSLLIEGAGRTILFDTGDNQALRLNLKALEKDPAAITDLVLSHGHYDHSGGIQAVLSSSGNINLYMHPSACQLRYSRKNGEVRKVHMPREVRSVLDNLDPSALNWVDGPLQITPEIGISGPIARSNTIEDTGGAFFLDTACQKADPIEDDMALWIRTPLGLAVCVGCSHAGIINTLATIVSVTGESRIHTVIGGLHLLNASDKRLDYTVAALNSLGIKQLIACHCTGDDSLAYLSRHLSCSVVPGYAGMSLTI